MKILLNKKAVFAVSIFSALFVSYVSAQSLSDIKFPVAELGNCESREECKVYCEEEENFAACSAFASKNNLKVPDGDKFDVIAEDGGPGNCADGSRNPVESCRAYCDIASHMKECVLYAKEHKLMEGRDLEEAEKVLQALEKGAKLPEGCTNRESCHKICEEPANVGIARECFAFAEAAGLLPPEVNREQAEKMFKAIEEGRAPFRSPKDFEQCDNPPNEEIMEKCINFALENGFLTGEEAEMVKKTGGKGPGGCRGRQCEAYCEANREACIAFAEEYGLVSAEDKATMEEGRTKLKEALSRSGEEVKSCIEDAVGRDTLEQIFSGAKRQTREIEEKMRGCFELQRKGADPFSSETRSCIESKIGSDGLKQLMENGPNPEMDEMMRSCFEKGEGERRERMPEGGEMMDKRREGFQGGEQEFEREGFRGERKGRGDFEMKPGMFPPGINEEDARRMMEERKEGMYPGGEDQSFKDFRTGEPLEGEYPMPRGDGDYPKEGSYPPPPPGGSEPSHENYNPTGGETAPPREENFTPPPPPPEVPTSFLPEVKGESLLANLIYFFSSMGKGN